MHAAVFTVDPLDPPGSGAHRLAVTCAHARTEFLYRPAGVPPALRLSERDAVRMVVIRHEASERCGCAATLDAGG